MNAQEKLIKELEDDSDYLLATGDPGRAQTMLRAIAEIQRQDRHLGFIAELSEQAADGNPGDIPYTQDAIALSNYARTHRFEDE